MKICLWGAVNQTVKPHLPGLHGMFGELGGWQLELGNQHQLLGPPLLAEHHGRAVPALLAVLGPGTSAVV